MNGDNTPDAPRMISSPKTNRATIIGISHHSLRAQRKRSSSPAMPSRETKSLIVPRMPTPLVVLVGLVVMASSLSDQERPYSEQIKPTVAEGVPGVGRAAHNRLAAQVERCIEQNGHARRLPKPPDHFIVTRVGLIINGLQTARPAFVGGRRNDRAFVRLDRADHEHEARWVVVRHVGKLEIIRRALGQ